MQKLARKAAKVEEQKGHLQNSGADDCSKNVEMHTGLVYSVVGRLVWNAIML
jgi:hypothetical protein